MMEDDMSTAAKFLTDNAFKLFALFVTLSFTVVGGVLTAFTIGATAWAWNMNEDNAAIKVSLSRMSDDVKELSVSLRSLTSLEKRLTYVETTRFTAAQAAIVSDKLADHEKRIRECEFILNSQ